MAHLLGAQVTTTPVPTMAARARHGYVRPPVRSVTPTLPSQPLPTPPAAAASTRAALVEEEEYTTQLPQIFHHGLPPPNQEPSTDNLEHPPFELFTSPPLRRRDEDVETPF